MATFTFPDGRWVRLRTMYVLDELAFDDLAATGEQLETARARIPGIQAQLEAATTDDERAAALSAAAETMAEYQKAYNAQLRAFYERLAEATEETSWGGPLGAKVTSDELGQLTRRWRASSEDETLPPV